MEPPTKVTMELPSGKERCLKVKLVFRFQQGKQVRMVTSVDEPPTKKRGAIRSRQRLEAT